MLIDAHAHIDVDRPNVRTLLCGASPMDAQEVLERRNDMVIACCALHPWYAQICSLMLRGLPLFEEETDFSPGQPLIYPRLYAQMRKYGVRMMHPETVSLSEEEQDCLKQVYYVLNGYSPNALKALASRAKRRIRRHLKTEADHLSAEGLKAQYEAGFRKAGVEKTEDLKKYIAEALKRSEG